MKGVKTTGRKTGERAMSGGSEGLAGLFLSPPQKVGSPWPAGFCKGEWAASACVGEDGMRNKVGHRVRGKR